MIMMDRENMIALSAKFFDGNPSYKWVTKWDTRVTETFYSKRGHLYTC